MASRFFDPNTQYRDDDGVIVAGGSLVFTITGTSTSKAVFGERALSTNLGNTIDLDASGRAETDFWLASDALYRVQLLDADDVQIWLRDDVGDANVGGLVPLDPADGTDGQFYSTDGVDALWTDIIQVPDPTGHSGEQLGTDGTLIFWEPQTVFDENNLPGGIEEVPGSSFRIGNTLIQRGSGSASTNGTANITTAVTFTTAYDSTPHVVVTVTNGPHNNAGWFANASAISKSASGFTANTWAGGEHQSGLDTTITTAVTFDWVAIGTSAP